MVVAPHHVVSVAMTTVSVKLWGGHAARAAVVAMNGDAASARLAMRHFVRLMAELPQVRALEWASP